MADEVIDEAEFAAATRAGEAERAGRPVPSSVRFDRASGRIVVEFTNGAAFMVPARQLQGLEKASDAELEDVSLLGETGLHWDALDVDFRISSLMAGVFGNARFMEAARKGGEARSEAKTAAARRNGQKGGRPRRTS